MLRISLCAIVRDQRSSLERCLASLAGVCDELCVVDTGSKDDSADIARRFGAHVGTFAWCDDFAAARNVSLKLASGDWALVLDADEELDLAAHSAEGARELLLKFAAAGTERVGRVGIDNRVERRSESVVAITRFFPLDGRHRFFGRVHEQVLRVAGPEPRTPARGDTGLHLLHHGYAPDEIAGRSKLERNLRLIELELAQRPDDAYLWFQSGRTLALAGQHERAVASLERALAHCRDSDDWAILALETGATSLRALGRADQALALVRSALPLVPERADTHFLAALLSLDLGDVAAAESGFRKCLTQRAPERAGLESSPSASGWAAAYNLGVVCEHTGRAREARELYERALAHHPGHVPSLAGLQRLATLR